MLSNKSKFFFSLIGVHWNMEIPQAPIIRPLLLIIYINDLPPWINCISQPILITDDTGLIISSRDFWRFLFCVKFSSLSYCFCCCCCYSCGGGGGCRYCCCCCCCFVVFVVVVKQIHSSVTRKNSQTNSSIHCINVREKKGPSS